MILKSKIDKYIFFNIPVILFSFLPLFLITGPFLSDLSISLISLLFLIYCVKQKTFHILRINTSTFFSFLVLSYI